MRQQLFFEGTLKNFANDRREADGPELLYTDCLHGLERHGSYTPVIKVKGLVHLLNSPADNIPVSGSLLV